VGIAGISLQCVFPIEVKTCYLKSNGHQLISMHETAKC